MGPQKSLDYRLKKYFSASNLRKTLGVIKQLYEKGIKTSVILHPYG